MSGLRTAAARLIAHRYALSGSAVMLVAAIGTVLTG